MADINLRGWYTLRANCERNKRRPKQCHGNFFEIGSWVSNSADNISSEITSRTSTVTKLVS